MAQITCEELNAVWNVKKQLEREQRRLVDLEICAGSTTPRLDGMPHTTPLTYKTERIATLILDCHNAIEQLSQQLVQSKFILLQKLKSFNLRELQERVLSYHYVACLKFKEIAKLMNYTSQYIIKLHSQGPYSLGLSLGEMNSCKSLSHFH